MRRVNSKEKDGNWVFGLLFFFSFDETKEKKLFIKFVWVVFFTF